MLYGLSKGQQKMSKSNPDSAIFMEDTSADVARKIGLAYCPRTEEAQAAVSEEESMQLTEDKLMNPCLDYVKHIIFCLPSATFAAAGTVFDSFGAVRDAFVGGKISEDELKSGLISAIDGLLEPVRSHFQNDAEAKRILGLIRGWMQEPKQERASPLRRLDALAGVSKPCVVFAPPPSARATVAAALDTLRCLAAAPAGCSRVLWLSDWSAFSLNCLAGGKTSADDMKAIAAANALFVGALEALAPELMGSVRVVVQSEAVLTSSSDYWISVINIGRAFQLSDVRAIDEANGEAGQVISTLMHVADVLAAAAPAEHAACVCATPAQTGALRLACAYLERPEVKASGLAPPTLIEVPSVPLGLKAVADGAAAVDDADAELLLADGTPDVQRKMKKAFCEPANAAFCPPLALAAELILPFGAERSLTIRRQPDNGGDLQLSDAASLAELYASGALHPGDLKPAVRDAVDRVLQRFRDAVKAKKELAAAQKEVDKVAKRAAKKK